MNLPVSLLDALDVGKLLTDLENTKYTVKEFCDKLEKQRAKLREQSLQWRLSLSPEKLEHYRKRRAKNKRRCMNSTLEKRLHYEAKAREYRKAYYLRNKEKIKQRNQEYSARKKAERLAQKELDNNNLL